MGRRVRFGIFIAIFQSLLILAHWFLYETWMTMGETPDPPAIVKVALAMLSVSFVAASLVTFRSSHLLVRLFYLVSATWLGLLSFCFLAACSWWILYGVAKLSGLAWELRTTGLVFFGIAVLVSLYGIINASWIRVRRITVRLPNLPESWRGRTAALVSDTHLGPIRGERFARSIVRKLVPLEPAVVFIAGDLYDGPASDRDKLAEPWARLSAPLGTYFVAGNHEEFSGRARCLEAIKRSGVQVLNNEKVVLQGLQIVGVHYRESSDAQRFQAILRQADLDRAQASILVTHSPHHLGRAEEAGISFAICGHTHAGQFFPYTWIAARAYGPFVYGLNRWGNLTVYTSSGAGTWGPPMRVGTKPEIVLIRFE